MGLERRGLVEEDLQGYVAAFLDGIWLKAPYLHNGSVPTLRDLVEPAATRPKVFWRGYDVFDPLKVGFVSDTPEAQRVGTRLDTAGKGGGNQGHEFGTALSAQDKDALVEYLKTL
jgi:cytochrome c peroxidase